MRPHEYAEKSTKALKAICQPIHPDSRFYRKLRYKSVRYCRSVDDYRRHEHEGWRHFLLSVRVPCMKAIGESGLRTHDAKEYPTAEMYQG